jgi:hypothetical protein
MALLRGDLSSWSADDRASLVRSLLDSVERKRSTESPCSNAEAYGKLIHPGLAAQLRSVITDGQLGVTTRRLGFLIAEKCKLKELQPELLQVALDATDHPKVRAGALSALKQCGDASVPSLVRPLAAGNAGPDPDDDIKGNALDLLWPDHITAAELFPLLTPSVDNYLGAYAVFQMTLPNTLKTADLLPALEWATQLIAQSDRTGGFRGKTLADAIMFKAWQVFENPELTRPFLEHIAVRLRHHGEFCRGTDHEAQEAFMSGLDAHVARRRKFLLAACADALEPIEVYSYHRAGLLIETDLEWLLSIAPGGSIPMPGLNLETLCKFIERTFVVENVAHFEAIYAAAERWPALRARYAHWFDGVRLDSPGAVQARAQQEQLRELEKDRRPPLVTDLSNQILARLAEAEDGRWQAWWRLTCYLQLTPQSRAGGDHFDYFITAMPGWRDADETLRRRIVASAERYLAEAETSIDDWLGQEPMPIYANDVAGLRAFILLSQVSPEGYGRIAGPIWQKWAPVIVGLPRKTVIDNSPDILKILTDAMMRAPAEFVGAVGTIIRLERERTRAPGATPKPGPPFFMLYDLDGCWDSVPLKDAIYDEFCNADNTPAEYGSLLDALLKVGADPALDHALGFLAESKPSTRGRNLAIAQVLLSRGGPLVASDGDGNGVRRRLGQRSAARRGPTLQLRQTFLRRHERVRDRGFIFDDSTAVPAG